MCHVDPQPDSQTWSSSLTLDLPCHYGHVWWCGPLAVFGYHPSPTLLFLFRCCDTAFFGKGMVLLAFLSQLRFPSLMQQYQPCFYLTTLSDRPVKLFTFPIFLFFSPGSEWTTCPVYSFFAQLILQIFYTHRVVLVLDIDSSKPVLPCLFTSFT